MASNQDKEDEFTIRIPTKASKKYHIMKFRDNDPAKWKQVRMVRENNKKEFKNPEEEMPKFGAGSEYGREEREEARRKKYGYASKKYDPDVQPWLMRIGGKKDGKHFRGQREGGVAENASYYVFVNAPGQTIEAIPIKEWYNFIPRVQYKTIDAEEAEEKFAQRDKYLNMWALKLNKKLKPEGEEDIDDEDGKKGKKGGKKSSGNDFKISDMDDMGSDDNELDSDSDEEDDKKGKKKNEDSDDEGKKKKGGKNQKKKKKSPEEVENEAFEDSDDGEQEGREIEYMSDESSEDENDEADYHDIKGVDADEGLAKMLDSDESDEEEKEDKDNKEEEGEPKEGKNGKKGGSGKNSANNSRSGSPTPEKAKEGEGEEKTSKAEKRKKMIDRVLDMNSDGPSSKKGRFEGPSTSQPALSGLEASFEEDVRRYLARKPHTTTEIIKKITSKRTGVSKEALMPLLVNVLKRIDPHKQKVKGVMYLSLKATK